MRKVGMGVKKPKGDKELAVLKKQVADLKKENEALKKQIADPKKEGGK